MHEYRYVSPTNFIHLIVILKVFKLLDKMKS